MTIIVCDMCGKKINLGDDKHLNFLVSQLVFDKTSHYEVCKDCHKKIEETIKSNPKELL